MSEGMSPFEKAGNNVSVTVGDKPSKLTKKQRRALLATPPSSVSTAVPEQPLQDVAVVFPKMDIVT